MTGLIVPNGSVSEPTLCCVDFQGIAGLIDTVLGHAPDRLRTLLNALFSSREQLEARVVIELVLRCRDPFSDLGNLCCDALKSAADLDLVLKARKWLTLTDVLQHPRPTALLNLCDEVLSEVTPYSAARRSRVKEIRPRVEIAAVTEMDNRRRVSARKRALRDALIPNLWSVLESYVSKDKARAALSSPR